MKRLCLLGILFCIALTGITCAPHDDTHVSPQAPVEPPIAGDAEKNGNNETAVEELIKVPEAYKKRIDAAREAIRRRHPLTNHGFWTVFHYILGVGPEQAYLRDADSGELVKAIDYICAGKSLPGLAFQARPDGSVDVITLAGSGLGQGHQDQFVAEMTQWGMLQNKEFIVDGKKHTFKNFTDHSKWNARLNQRHELSWAVLIIGEHAGTNDRWTVSPKENWTNYFGEQLNLEDIVRYELEPINATTTCGGTHRLFDLTWVYFRHLQRGGKKEGVWKDAADYLEKYKKQAKEYQNKDGTFSTKYIFDRGNEPDVELRVNTTGHVLEWLALYLSDAELREPWMQRAVGELATLVVQNAHRSFDGGSYYHSAHALEIYRKRVFGTAEDDPPLPKHPGKDR